MNTFRNLAGMINRHPQENREKSKQEKITAKNHVAQFQKADAILNVY